MTKLPWPSWAVRAVEGEAYVLNDFCAVCQAGMTPFLEKHHIWRRSFIIDKDAWWVELEDGRLVPNLVNLCSECHRLVTTNQAHIVLYDTEGGLIFNWVQGHENKPLDPQPGPRGDGSGQAAVGNQADGPVAMQQTIDGSEKDHYEVCDEHQGTEETCSRCRGTGRVKRRVRQDKEEKARPKVTWSVRVPRDERENGHEVLTQLIDACVEQDVERGELREANSGARYYVLVRALHEYLTREVNQ